VRHEIIGETAAPQIETESILTQPMKQDDGAGRGGLAFEPLSKGDQPHAVARLDFDELADDRDGPRSVDHLGSWG
jgi:hypothetical protein